MVDPLEIISCKPDWLHIDSGTLLGITRDGNLIPGDNDLDFACEYSSFNKRELESFVEKYGYRLHYYSRRGLVYKVKCRSDSLIDIDITIFFKLGDGYISPIKSFEKKLSYPYRLYYYHSRVVNLDLIPAVNFLTFFIPGSLYRNLDVEPSSYLTFRYGDWMSPKSDWDFISMDGAVIYSDLFKLLEGYDN